ncbi:hypothetical protein KPSA3_05768 [Pseudomonas syringae pv. actinidiae]|uniref:Uncharacterized protein n=1 Tax=Pseudomonas syringae pv. actinidiae TaxID=103796 RepID=A0AAN4TNY1_PSESF|nr:hypothetical protein KPSA3_05768 [Pseudomonas syringae pv. actinidiae]
MIGRAITAIDLKGDKPWLLNCHHCPTPKTLWCRTFLRRLWNITTTSTTTPTS